MSRRYVIPALLLTFVILLAVPALAQNQDTQGTGTLIYGCTIIDKPGPYALAKSFTARQSDLKRIGEGIRGCILIVADFVSLDLRGYTITGPGLEIDAFGIYSTVDARGKWPTAVNVRNGSVTKFNRGMTLEGAGHTVEQVRFAGNYIEVLLDGTGIKAKDVIAVSNGIGVFLWYGYGHSVEHCQVHSNSEGGIYMRDYPVEGLPSLPHASRIVGNTVSDNVGFGIYAVCPSLILQNMAYDNPPGPGVKHNIVLVPGSSDCTLSDNNPEVPEYQDP